MSQALIYSVEKGMKKSYNTFFIMLLNGEKMTLKRVLVVDSDDTRRDLLTAILKKGGYLSEGVANFKAAGVRLSGAEIDFLVPVLDREDLKYIKNFKSSFPKITIIAVDPSMDTFLAVDAVSAGAEDCISGTDPSQVIVALKKAEEREKTSAEETAEKSLPGEAVFKNIVSKSPKMREILDTIKKISEYKTTVLLMGESGTGKEVIARAIHYNSSRAGRPFITVNCGAIPENLLESELFGHVKGAFTGAHKTKKGLFEEADGGTLFLDEIGELPLLLQVKLLRVLQEEEIRRVGDTRSIKIDVRIIAATVKDLVKEVERGNFREDLFYRLNVLAIYLPALRERREDIPLLIDHFVAKYNEKLGTSIKGASPDALKLLLEYDWQGNVRELENVIERAMVLAHSDLIEPQNLPPHIRGGNKRGATLLDTEEYSIKKMTRLLEERLIMKALHKTRGNRTKAAKLLEISHRALLYKIKQYGLEDRVDAIE